MKRGLYTFLAGAVLVIFSCRKEIKGPEWDVDVFAPIINSTFGLDDLIADSLLQTNPDNSVTLVYNNNFYGLTADSLVAIPDTTIDTFYVIPFGQLQIPPGGNIATINQNTQYDVNGVELTKVIIRSGYMTVQLRSLIEGKTRITYQIPGALDVNLQPFSVVEYLPASSSNIPSVLNRTYDLSGYTIDLRGPSLNSFNTIQLQMIADVDPAETTNPVVIQAGDSVVISNGFIDIVPQYAKGYFGQDVYSVSETTDFDMFRHITGGILNLDSVKVNLKIENSVGVDARVRIGSLTSTNTTTSTSVSLNHPIINSPVNINRAIDFGNGNVVPGTWSVQLDNTNSNIKQMIENLPDQLGYTVDAEINPLGNVSGGNDFIYYGDGLRANLDMEIPLWFSASQLTLADTLDYGIDIEDQNINHGTLTLYAENGFPFEASVQLFVMNSSNTIVEELTPVINTIDEGVVDNNLVVTQTRLTKLVIPINETKMNALYANKRLYVKVKLNTYGFPNYVKIYSHYNIGLKLVGDFNYHVTLH